MTPWAAAGLALCLVTGAVALRRARTGTKNFYESGVYGMTRQTHTRYALVSFVMAALFAVSYVEPAFPVIPLLAAAVLLSIFYFTSFLRGFSDEE